MAMDKADDAVETEARCETSRIADADTNDTTGAEGSTFETRAGFSLPSLPTHVIDEGFALMEQFLEKQQARGAILKWQSDDVKRWVYSKMETLRSGPVS